MFIKLQADQVFMFWDLIKRGVVQSYGIPQEYRQNFSIKFLERLLTGLSQAWIAYLEKDKVKKINAIVCTKILNEEHHGVRVLYIDTLYGFRLIEQPLMDEAVVALEAYAKANNCDVIAAEYSLKRVGDILTTMGFENHRTISRKVLNK